MESSLASVLVDGRPYFTVIGVSAPAGDQGKPMQWVDNSKSKARPIRYGAEGLVDGHIDQNDWQDERYSEDRSECVDHDDKGRCVRTHTRHVPCTRRRLHRRRHLTTNQRRTHVFIQSVNVASALLLRHGGDHGDGACPRGGCRYLSP